MNIDPLFKIKQIFGSVEQFEKILEEVGEKDTPVYKKITTEIIENLDEYKRFARGRHIDVNSKGSIVRMLRKCYKHHLQKTT